jgi:hypothetical protein
VRYSTFANLLAGLSLLTFYNDGYAQTDLHAPLVSKPPSISSEIKGVSLRQIIARHPLMLLIHRFFIIALVRRTKNRQSMGQNFEAFDCGLYFRARLNQKGVIKVLESALGQNNALTLAAKSQLLSFESAFNASKAILSINDDQVEEAVFLP